MAKINKSKVQKRQIYFWGIFAEFLAILFLTFKFYRFLKWRAKTPMGEIDLVFQKGNILIFIEVKARKNHEAARLAISKNQQQRIINAAQYFVQHFPNAYKMQWRFDAVLIAPFKFPLHIKNAFDRN